MSFIDADAILDGATLRTDICVIGSGAAGITLARQLDGSALNVIVVEAGGLKRDVKTEADTFAIDHAGTPYRNPIPGRGRWYGGSTNLWFGRIAQLDPIDFERRDWVANSGWPVSYEDLRPWLRVASELLEVPAFERIDLSHWAPNPTTDLFVTRGRANLAVFLWADGLLMGQRSTDVIERSGNVRVLLDSTATALNAGENSKTIDSLSIQGKRGHRFSVEASRFVLAAGGLENPRLLLSSTLRSAAGVGNEFDNVGRYYMDHPRGEGLAGVDLRTLPRPALSSVALLGEKARTPYGKAQLRVVFPESMQRHEHLLNHSLHAHLVSDIHGSAGYLGVRRMLGRVRGREAPGQSDFSADLRALLKDSPRIARFGAMKLARRERPDELVVIDQMEQEPDRQSRVTVDHRQLDRYGMPRLRLDWRISESTFRSQRRMHEFFGAILAQADIHTFWSSILDGSDSGRDVLDMKHPSGTTRMSESPRTGVVDGDCRVHGVANLYIAGSSVFPTAGHANPTLTIVALAARLANHLQHPGGDGS